MLWVIAGGLWALHAIAFSLATIGQKRFFAARNEKGKWIIFRVLGLGVAGPFLGLAFFMIVEARPNHTWSAAKGPALLLGAVSIGMNLGMGIVLPVIRWHLRRR